MPDPAYLELVSELYRKIASVTCRFDFTAPVESADIDVVCGELVRALPKGFEVLVCREPDARHVLVEVYWPDGARLYRRQMIVG